VKLSDLQRKGRKMGTAFEYHLDENFNQSGKKHGFCSTRIAGLHDEFPTQVM